MTSEEKPPSKVQNDPLLTDPIGASSQKANMANPLSGKRILVVNTGSRKKRFIFERLKKLDLHIICLNKEINWASRLVDEWIVADTYNHAESINAVTDHFKQVGYKPDGIITFWEDDVLLTSKLVDRLKLNGIPYAKAEYARNKFKFRQFCRQNGLPAPDHILINSRGDLAKVREQLEFPIVLKPAYGSITALVVKVEEPKDLDEIYSYVVNQISTDIESSLNDGLQIFAEEYIDGDEVDIDIILQNGKIKSVIVSDNFDKSRGKFFLDLGQCTPSNLPAYQQSELINMAELVLEKIGIFDGCIHFEGKYSSKGPYPLEANLRMGGDYVYSYLKTAWNIDYIELAVKVALGIYIPPLRNMIPKKHVIGKDLSTEFSGILNELSIDPSLKKKSYFEDSMVYKELGDALFVPPEGSETLGWITVSGLSYPDAQDNLQKALAEIKYSVAKFDYKSYSGISHNGDALSRSSNVKRLLRQRERINYIGVTDLKQQNIVIVTNVNQYSDKDNYAYLQEVYQYYLDHKFAVELLTTETPTTLIAQLQKKDYDLVVNFIEPTNNNTGIDLIKTLEILGLPFTGPDSFTVKLIQDKIRTNKILEYHEISMPEWDYVFEHDDPIDDLEYPLIVKPAYFETKVGIDENSVVTSSSDLKKRVDYVLDTFKCPALIEEFVSGREIEVIVTGNENRKLEVSEIQLITFPAQIKPAIITNATDLSELKYDSKIRQKVKNLVGEIAMDIFSILNCHDYLKVDFRLDEKDNPFVIDINATPFLRLTGKRIPIGPLQRKITEIAISRYRE